MSIISGPVYALRFSRPWHSTSMVLQRTAAEWQYKAERVQEIIVQLVTDPASSELLQVSIDQLAHLENMSGGSPHPSATDIMQDARLVLDRVYKSFKQVADAVVRAVESTIARRELPQQVSLHAETKSAVIKRSWPVYTRPHLDPAYADLAGYCRKLPNPLWLRSEQ